MEASGRVVGHFDGQSMLVGQLLDEIWWTYSEGMYSAGIDIEHTLHYTTHTILHCTFYICGAVKYKESQRPI